MKQLIVLTAMILLGIFIFQLIAGRQDGSVFNEVKNVWEMEIEARKMGD
ncbi:MAG TPA: hypothetical protein PL035_02485 [Bacillota bacterium]|nr:hypothetical protein [Bacillota bacterium]HQC35932.1 hypothetical protein [Bacillota bacterium]